MQRPGFDTSFPAVAVRAAIAQLVRALDCGSRGPPFEAGWRYHHRATGGSPEDGRAQREGGPVEEIRPGDVVWFAPGEKHWHGAAPTTAMTHIAIQEALDGKAVTRMEKVSDEQVRA